MLWRGSGIRCNTIWRCMKSRGKEICGAEPFRDRAVKCTSALDAHVSFEFHDERTMRCFPWRASKWEDDAAGSLPAPEAFGQERRQRRNFFLCAAEEKMRRRADTTAESFRDRAVKCAGALDAHVSFEFYGERTMRCFPWRASKWEDDAAGSLPAPEAFGREQCQCRGFFFRALRKRKCGAERTPRQSLFAIEP